MYKIVWEIGLVFMIVGHTLLALNPDASIWLCTVSAIFLFGVISITARGVFKQ